MPVMHAPPPPSRAIWAVRMECLGDWGLKQNEVGLPGLGSGLGLGSGEVFVFDNKVRTGIEQLRQLVLGLGLGLGTCPLDASGKQVA